MFNSGASVYLFTCLIGPVAIIRVSPNYQELQPQKNYAKMQTFDKHLTNKETL